MSVNYHGRIAVGHFARKLAAECDGARKQYQVIAVLQALWLAAPDPYADAPFVRMPLEQLEGIVPTHARLSQIAAKLKAIGAAERSDFGFRLLRPAIGELDSVAAGEVQSAVAVLGRNSRRVTDRSDDAPRTRADTLDAGRQTLERFHKRPSDVAHVLETMAGKRTGSVRYSGRGSGAVQEAITWLVETGTTWAGFVQLCEYVRLMSNKPSDVEWLFGDKLSEYRERALTLLQAECNYSAAANESIAEPATSKPKRLGEIERATVERWFRQQVGTGHDDAVDGVWGDSAAVATLLDLTGPEATERIHAWQADPVRPLVEHFA